MSLQNMTKKGSLMTQKTFDQIRILEPDAVKNPDAIAPNRVVPCNLVFEPNTHAQQTRVRVTARDADFNVLWGANISESMIPAEHPTPVAVYGRLREIIRENVSNPQPRFEVTENPYTAIEACDEKLRALLGECVAKTLSVKNKSDVTDKRAEHIARAMSDAVHQLTFMLNEIGIGSDLRRELKQEDET